MADCRVAIAAGQVLATYALGSCIGLAVYDPKARRRRIAALHAAGFGASIRRAARQNPVYVRRYRHPALIEQVCGAGRHQAAVWWRMRRAGRRSWIRISGLRYRQTQLSGAAQDPVEGRHAAERRSRGRLRSRTVRLEIGSGQLWLQEGGGQAELVVSARAVPNVKRMEQKGGAMAYRVLIADDSPVMRSFVRRVIELSGFELSACFEADNGEEALAVLRRGVGGRDPDRHQHAGDGWRGVPAPPGGRRHAAIHSGDRDFHRCHRATGSIGCWRWARAAT